MPDATKRQLVGPEPVADRLGEPIWKCYELARRGILPSVRLGRRVKFDLDAIEAWIARGGSTGDSPGTEAA